MTYNANGSVTHNSLASRTRGSELNPAPFLENDYMPYESFSLEGVSPETCNSGKFFHRCTNGTEEMRTDCHSSGVAEYSCFITTSSGQKRIFTWIASGDNPQNLRGSTPTLLPLL